MSSTYWDAVLASDLTRATCAKCGALGQLRLELRPLAKPRFVAQRDFSLAGTSMKVSAVKVVEWPWMVCGACGRSSEGKFE